MVAVHSKCVMISTLFMNCHKLKTDFHAPNVINLIIFVFVSEDIFLRGISFLSIELASPV